ncbi:MAG: hypothetical protein GXP57_03585 [Deltaproteobacteria bacterium]|nr:hypothetical protein [Deltaproteobacteria bacterium]
MKILRTTSAGLLFQAVFFGLAAVLLSGCLLTKVVTVPMRLGGAVVSIIPVAGNPAHDAIDEAAATVDKIPL